MRQGLEQVSCLLCSSLVACPSIAGSNWATGAPRGHKDGIRDQAPRRRIPAQVSESIYRIQAGGSQSRLCPQVDNLTINYRRAIQHIFFKFLAGLDKLHGIIEFHFYNGLTFATLMDEVVGEFWLKIKSGENHGL